MFMGIILFLCLKRLKFIEKIIFTWGFALKARFLGRTNFLIFSSIYGGFLSSQVIVSWGMWWDINAWCPLKGHTYLNKPAAESCVRYNGLDIIFWMVWVNNCTCLFNLIFAKRLSQGNYYCLSNLFKVSILIKSDFPFLSLAVHETVVVLDWALAFIKRNTAVKNFERAKL